jgi:glycosyltransferase involved in cell wall biosynthesis
LTEHDSKIRSPAPDQSLPRIGYVTIHDLRAWRSWPENEFGHLANASMLARVFEDLRLPVAYLGPLPTTGGLFTQLRAMLHRRRSQTRYLRFVEPGVLRRQARAIERKAKDVDLLFGNNSRPFAQLRTSLPVVIWRDATFAGALEVHRDFRNISARSMRLGHRMERAALEKCTAAVFRSQWAADQALYYYDVDPAKVFVIPTGGNILTPPSRASVADAIDARPKDRCELLFVGVDWEGKGGPVALDVARRLHEAGLPVRLTVVGGHPARQTRPPPYVRTTGFIDIHNTQDRQRYKQLLSESHFLLFPTRVDTYGNVLPEANAFGLPCLTSGNAGISTIIRNGVNGRIFPPGGETEAQDYAAFIEAIMNDREAYRSFALSAYDEYRLRLGWDVVGPRIRQLFLDVCEAAHR